MDFSKLLPTLASVAPVIAGLLGGPLASMGVQALEGVFGLTPGSGADSNGKPSQAMIQAVSGMSPEVAIKLAEIDADLKSKLIQAGIDLETIAAGDRNSARQREMSVKDWTPRVLAFCVVGGFLGMAYGVLFKSMSADSALAGTVIGYLSAKAEQIVAYYFGSSAGSAKKDETITALSR